jgi:hypothetical protein
MNRRQLVFGRELRKLLPVSDGDWIWEHDHRARMAPRRRSERALEIVHTSDSDRLRKTLHQSALDGMKTQCHDDGNRARRLLRGHGRSCRERSDDVDLELDQFGRQCPHTIKVQFGPMPLRVAKMPTPSNPRTGVPHSTHFLPALSHWA